MTSTVLDLNKMGLSPLSEFEMQEIDGGNFWKWLGKNALTIAALIVSIISTAKN